MSLLPCSFVLFFLSQFNCSCLDIIRNNNLVFENDTYNVIFAKGLSHSFQPRSPMMSCFFIAFFSAESYCLSSDTESEPKRP